MIDSHCHLDHEPLFSDLSNIIKRSKDAGIEKLLTISTTLESFEKIKNLTKRRSLNIKPVKLKKNNFAVDLKASLVINTIPINDYYSRVKQNVENIYKKRIFGYDLVYNDNTNFLNLFTSSRQINGINLLIHQAAPCFEEWFGIKPKIDKGLFDLIYQKLREIK